MNPNACVASASCPGCTVRRPLGRRRTQRPPDEIDRRTETRLERESAPPWTTEAKTQHSSTRLPRPFEA